MFMNQQKLFKRSYIYIYAGIFFILFIFNYLTPYLVDDFTYRLSFATFKPLQNLWEIFPSMAAHTKSMNGRTTAHFLVQLFMLMPPLVFDIVNSFFSVFKSLLFYLSLLKQNVIPS